MYMLHFFKQWLFELNVVAFCTYGIISAEGNKTVCFCRQRYFMLFYFMLFYVFYASTFHEQSSIIFFGL